MAAEAAHAAVDVGVQGTEEAVGAIFEEHLDAGGISLVIAQADGVSDQSHRRLVELAVERDGAILVDLAAHHGAEVVTQILGRGAQQFQVAQIALQGRLPGAGVNALMVAVIKPLGELRVELIKAVVVTDQRQQLGAYGPEKAFDLALSLWCAGGCEEQRHAE